MMQNVDGVPIGCEFWGTPWSKKSDENPPGGDTEPPGGNNP